MTPSKHFARYDAQTYETEGFLQLSGRVQEMSLKPRFWQVTATAVTYDPETNVKERRHFKFRTEQRCRLSELAPIVNNKIHEDDDYLPDCLSVMVVARIMI